MNLARFRTFLIGRYAVKFSLPYLALLYTSFTCSFLLAYGSFPGRYSIGTNVVSNLGNPELNPLGWTSFLLALILFGVLSAPAHLHVYWRLVTGQRHLAIAFLSCSMVASAGSIGVGVFPELAATNFAHSVAAGMAFGGLLLAAIASWIPCFMLARRSPTREVRLARLALLLGQVLVVLLVIIMNVVIHVRETMLAQVGGGVWSRTTWQWMLLFSIGLHLVLLTVNANGRIT
jgi:hypothetical protein